MTPKALARPYLRDLALLWIGVLAPPVAWLVSLQANYLLVEGACRAGNALPLHVATGLTLLLAVGGGILAWRGWTRSGRGTSDDEVDESGRLRFLALLGIVTSALFGLVIIAQEIPNSLLSACA